MRVYQFFIYSVLLLAQAFAQMPEEEASLTRALVDYQSLQTELNELLKLKSADCSLETDPSRGESSCLLKNYCQMPAVDKDSPILYQNKKGQKIVNEQYYNIRNSINACLREKYSDEIAEKRDELTQRLGSVHLQKIIAANKALIALTAKHGQGAKLQRISAEILNISMEAGINNEAAVWGMLKSGREELLAVLTLAEKRTKNKLHPDIKKKLVEIEYLKANPLFLEEVASFEKELLPQFSPKDPFFDWSLLTDASAAGGPKALAKNREQLVKKSQEAYALFEETQKDIITYLNEKKTQKNLNEIERIIERVKTIKFNTPRLTAEVREYCKYPNAFYNASNHSFTLCPQYLNYPSIALKETIAHEMAHSFDSCNLSGNFYKNKGPEIFEEAPFEIEIIKTPVSGNFRNTRGETPVELNPKNKIQGPMLYADHPFSKTMSCLQDSRSVGAKVSDIEGLRQDAKAKLAALTKLGQNNGQNAEARGLNYFVANERDYFDHFQGCDNSSLGERVGRSQMQEAFADKISSEIIARDLKKLSREEARHSVLEIALSYGNICPNQTAAETKLRMYGIKEGCPEYLENMSNEKKILLQLERIDPSFDPHPSAVIRIEKNLLANPATRQLLKCPKDRGVLYCE